MAKKQDLIISCACGYSKCHEQLTVKQNDEDTRLTVLSVSKEEDPLRPKFFELNRDGALDLARWLIANYKLRGEILGGGSSDQPSKKSKESPKQVIVEEVSEDQPELFEGYKEVVESEEPIEEPIIEQPVKRGRGRPKKVK